MPNRLRMTGPSARRLARLAACACAVLMFGAGGAIARRGEIRIPVWREKPDPPVACIYDELAAGNRAPGRGADLEQVIVAIWGDGTVIWSERVDPADPSLRPAYRRGAVPADSVGELLSSLAKADALAEKGSRSSWFGPDSSYTALYLDLGEKTVALLSWHELYEANGKLLAAATGLRSRAEGKSVDEELAAEPAEYRRFRANWDDLKGRILDLRAKAESKGARELEFRFMMNWKEIKGADQ